MAGELSLVEEIMSGKLNSPSARRPRLYQRGRRVRCRKKKKEEEDDLARQTRVVDDLAATKISVAKAASAPSTTPVGTPQISASVDSSRAKPSRKIRSKLTESEGMLVVSLPDDGFAYSDPSFMKEVSTTLLLPANHKRLTDIRPIQSAE